MLHLAFSKLCNFVIRKVAAGGPKLRKWYGAPDQVLRDSGDSELLGSTSEGNYLLLLKALEKSFDVIFYCFLMLDSDAVQNNNRQMRFEMLYLLQMLTA